MDSLGTGFLVQSLLALWLFQNFQISVSTAAAILFWSGIFSARLLLGSGVVMAHHVTRAATRAPSKALPRRRALCTN
jgi:hypothetical protein